MASWRKTRLAKLYKSIVLDGDLTLSVLDTTDIVNDAIKIHKLTPLTAAALGRALTVCTFMSGGLKNKSDKLSISINGNGVGGKITVCGNSDLEVRGSIDNPNVSLPLKDNGKLDVSGCVGNSGRITVVKSMGLKEPYVGTSNIVSGELGEDFATYFALSEQIPTALAIGVKIGKDLTCVGAGGVVLQALPNAKEENLIKAENIVNSLTSVSTVIEEKGIDGLVKKYFGDIEYQEYYPKYKCLCSQEYIEKLLISLGKAEVDDIIKTEGAVKIGCQFCDKEYVFTKEDAERIFNE